MSSLEIIKPNYILCDLNDVDVIRKIQDNFKLRKELSEQVSSIRD
jgi:hypothetical protein